MDWKTWQRGEYEISTDPARVDLAMTHRFLSEQAYWSEGVPLEVVKRAIAGSIVFGAYLNRGGEPTGDQLTRSNQVGFARVVTDRATFAWIGDVFVLAEHRGDGLGKWLMECIKAHPDLQGLRRWMLATRDAHSLYEQYGFTLVEPGRFMEIRDSDVYKRRA